MNSSSDQAANGYNPWNAHDRYVPGVHLNRSGVTVSELAAERYALLQAVAELKSSPEQKARRRPVRRRAPAVATKTA